MFQIFNTLVTIFQNMDEFISAIYRNEMLWNKTHKNYKNNSLKSYIWSQIGKEFGISGEDAEKKYISLRQKYCREKNIEKDSFRSGSAASSQKRWEYFEALTFLDSQITKRGSCSSLKKIDTKEEIDIVQSVSNTPLGFAAESQCYITTDLETAGSDFQLDADLDLSSKDSERSTEIQSQILYTPTQRKASSQDNPLHINKRQKKHTSDDFSELIAAMKAPVTIEQTMQPESSNQRMDSFLSYLGQSMKNVPQEKIRNLEMEILQLVNRYIN